MMERGIEMGIKIEKVTAAVTEMESTWDVKIGNMSVAFDTASDAQVYLMERASEMARAGRSTVMTIEWIATTVAGRAIVKALAK